MGGHGWRPRADPSPMRRLAFDPARPEPPRRSPTSRPGRHHHDPTLNLETDSTNDEPEDDQRAARLSRRASLARGSAGPALDPPRPRHLRPGYRAVDPRHPVALHPGADARTAPLDPRELRNGLAVRVGVRIGL